MRIVRLSLVLGIVVLTSWFGPNASAACHFFTVGASSSVTEGNTVSVIVERDAALADSSVRVTTVDGSAKAPADYEKVDQRVEFTGDETQKTIKVKTTEDVVAESSEAFQVKVSDAQGCAPNQNYGYGDPAAVTIKDDDAVPAPTPSPTPRRVVRTPLPTETPSATPTPTGSATPSPTPKPTKSPKPSPTETATLTPVPVEEESGFPWLPVLGIGGFLAAAGGALMLVRMRGAGP